jgi:1-acyl-sn-glycerol-3-phosphate acyltransferase
MLTATDLEQMLGDFEEHKINFFKNKNGYLGKLFWFWFRLDVRGLENLPEGFAVLAPNHSSRLDIAGMIGSVDCYLRFYAREGLRREIPGFITKEFGPIGVRTLDRRTLRCIEQLIAYDIENETKIVTFLEGGTSGSYEIREAKTGLIEAVLKQKSDALFVPVSITYSPDITKYETIPIFGRKINIKLVTKNLALFKTKVNITYGAPVSADGCSVQQVADTVMYKISEMSGKKMTQRLEERCRAYSLMRSS